MKAVDILFFGTNQDSVNIVESLHRLPAVTIAACVTQPPSSRGKSQSPTPTPIAHWAQEHNIHCYSFAPHPDIPIAFVDEREVINTLSTLSYSLVVSASYGQRIPDTILDHAALGGINVHPSLLPRFRGADPIPWTILSGDTIAGTTILRLASSMDSGAILSQQQLPLTGHETREDLRRELFRLGCELLPEVITSLRTGTSQPIPQPEAEAVYARRLTKQDGYLSWHVLHQISENIPQPAEAFSSFFQACMPKQTPIPAHIARNYILRANRALSPWPGFWTTVTYGTHKVPKRMKLLTSGSGLSDLIGQIQVEGKTPTDYSQLASVIYCPECDRIYS